MGEGGEQNIYSSCSFLLENFEGEMIHVSGAYMLWPVAKDYSLYSWGVYWRIVTWSAEAAEETTTKSAQR